MPALTSKHLKFERAAPRVKMKIKSDFIFSFYFLVVLCISITGNQAHSEIESPALFMNFPYSAHAQATTVTQAHGSANAPSTANAQTNTISQDPERRTSFTSTLFLGARLFEGTELYLNPELVAGSGISDTHGIAGYTNGEIYRVDSAGLKATLSRAYLRKSLGLGGDKEKIESNVNSIAGEVDIKRVTLTLGKFSLNDLFDDNLYSHDPRTQFLNWSLMDNGAWDYAADTRGYTWGLAIEFNQPTYAIRFVSALVPKQANQLEMDLNISKAHSENAEFEYRYHFLGHPGKSRCLIYFNHANMGTYVDAVQNTNPNRAADITESRDYSSKYGLGLNFEQELTNSIGGFFRAGWNDGRHESWAFTEIDQTASAGIVLKGSQWHRTEDTAGLALIYNEISTDHRNYLAAGGLGFMIGDGSLSYAPEEIIETYYAFKIVKENAISADIQYVNHPGYNQDHAPATVFGVRLHAEI
jgi:high affinity Mn2+ porin